VIAIAFRRSVPLTFWSQVVRLFAGAPVHCAIVLPDGTGWEAQLGVGVQPVFVPPDDADWERVPVQAKALTAIRFAHRRAGARYDLLGAVLYGTPLTSRDRWTCSELCAEALAEAGAPLSILPAGRTPRRLRAWALAHTHTETPHHAV
jgi:hypothetical protein